MHEHYSQKDFLKRLKPKVKLIVMDHDGTIKGSEHDRKYSEINISDLFLKMLQRGIIPAVITASGASAVRLYDGILPSVQKENGSLDVYIAIGNGTTLYRYGSEGKATLYHNDIEYGDIHAILDIWKDVLRSYSVRSDDINAKGIMVFQKFLQEKWDPYIPSPYLKISRSYQGTCFVEPYKITFVMPGWDEGRQSQLKEDIQSKLHSKIGNRKYNAYRGDAIFLHVIRATPIDAKFMALRAIQDHLGITDSQIIAIGDMPYDNDYGMLIASGLPYTFTNAPLTVGQKANPPYGIEGPRDTPIGNVYAMLFDFLE